MPVRIRVNGRSHDVDVPGSTPLLWVLRDELGLTGTKYGCGVGLCGACTVHIDSRSVRSCLMRLDAVDGDVTTIEGLSPDGGHPVQRAWVEADVPQCGYCQAGQIMTAAAMLAENPAPTDAEIEAGMSGVICRCGTYPRIARAVRRAAGREDE